MVRATEGAGFVWSGDGGEQELGNRLQATGHRKSKATAKPSPQRNGDTSKSKGSPRRHGGTETRRHGEKLGGKTKSKAKSRATAKPLHHGGHRGAQRSHRDDRPRAIGNRQQLTRHGGPSAG